MALRSFRDFNPSIIGVVSVVVIAAMTAAAFAIGTFNLLEDAYSVTAVFADSAGISGGDDVRVAGVKVGRVTAVEANRQEGNVRVKMVVNDGVDLGPETNAEIALETLLGTKFVRLGGDVVEPYLEGGAVIPIERTKIPFDVFELARVGAEAIEQTDTERLNLLVDQLANITEGRREDFARLFDGLQRVAGSLSSREDELRALFDRVETISTTLSEKDQVLVRLLDQSKGVLEVLNEHRDELRDGLQAADLLTAQLASLAGTHKETLDNLLETVHDAAAILDARQEDLDRALARVGPGALGLAKATMHGPWNDIFAIVADEDPSEETTS